VAWAQKYQARFAKPLLNQLIAIIQRDQAAALAVVNARRAADGLPALKAVTEYHKVSLPRTKLPWLTLAIDGDTFTHESEDMTREQLVEISLELDAGQFDTEHAQDDAQDYAWMLDMVVTTAPLSDWTAALAITHKTVPSGTTSPSAAANVEAVLVNGHRPQIRAAEGIDGPVMHISLPLEFYMEET
jgi:hypothetical protein